MAGGGRLGGPVAGALAALHRVGVRRDVKPPNMVQLDGRRGVDDGQDPQRRVDEVWRRQIAR